MPRWSFNPAGMMALRSFAPRVLSRTSCYTHQWWGQGTLSQPIRLNDATACIHTFHVFVCARDDTDGRLVGFVLTETALGRQRDRAFAQVGSRFAFRYRGSAPPR